MIIVVLVGH